ncbi:MAG TPA: Flp pilus assembly protein CpaB [Gemmataceae bacterium]|nr:Flp pilus assembly protein CpaB [Gemmataceae bacterium]
MKQKNMVLMVVAVGCGLVAAFLTSQMSGRTAQVEQVEVIVAAKDLPVGTQLSKDDLKTAIKRKKLPKDGLPPAYVMDENLLVDKRMSRPIRAEETFNPADLSTGGVVTIPAGMHMHTLPIGVPQAVAGFAGPGSRVDVLVTIRLGTGTKAFPLLMNMLILAVDTQTAYTKDGTFQQLNSVSFAVDRKQALLLELAKSRGCSVALMLRNPDDKGTDTEGYDIEKVTALLSDDMVKSEVKTPVNDPGRAKTGAAKGEATTPEGLTAPAPKPTTVMVPVATEDIPAGTDLTKDLIAAKFKTIELPLHLADGVFTDLTPALGKVFRTGLAKNQWVTEALVGIQPPKPAPQDTDDTTLKPGPVEPKPAVTQGPAPSEAKPVKPVAPKKATKDLALTTPHGVTLFRYEEYAPGKWRYLGEFPATGDATEESKPAKPRVID